MSDLRMRNVASACANVSKCDRECAFSARLGNAGRRGREGWKTSKHSRALPRTWAKTLAKAASDSPMTLERISVPCTKTTFRPASLARAKASVVLPAHTRPRDEHSVGREWHSARVWAAIDLLN